jgi:photosystem II stability/assembly factor-like uncharacterized protein
MAPLNRSQYLQGNASEGPVLAGKVQAVKEGEGTKINPDGSIDVDASTAKGLVRTNNSDAFNSYIFPNEDGTGVQALFTDGDGNLSWGDPSKGAVVHVGPTAPENPRIGQLWYKSGTKQVYIFENVDGGSEWTVAHSGLDVNAENVTCSPDFADGDGTSVEDRENGTGLGPFTVVSAYAKPGTVRYFDSTVSISGLAPHQYVPINDLEEVENGYRFGVSNNFADENGVLTFQPRFQDFPESESSTAFSATYKIGFTGVYLSASVQILAPLTLESAGLLAGGDHIGEIVTYTPGVATGGVPPYQYSWLWRSASSSEILQTGGDNLEIPSGLVGDQIYVELIAIDSRQTRVSLSTAPFPASPSSILKGSFPETDVAFPAFSNQEVETLWKDQDMLIYATGCVEIKVDDGVDTWGQQARVIENGQTLVTRWLDSDGCLGSPHNSTIAGCVESDDYQDCDSLLLDKVPSPFTFTPAKDVIPGSVISSNTITPVGYNSKAFVTFNGGALSMSSLEASLDGGSTWAQIPAQGIDTLPIQPGETLTVRGTVGSDTLTDFKAQINIGQGDKVQSAVFVATTSDVTDFATAIPSPVTTYQGYDTETPPSVTWLAGDGAQTISCTGCLEFRINGGAWRNSASGGFSIATGNTLETRWSSGASCGGAAHGIEISGTITNGSNKTTKRSLTIDRVPAAFSLKNKIGEAISSVSTSEIIPLSGYNADCYISYNNGSTSLTSPEVSISSGGFVSLPTKGSTSILVRPVVPGNTPKTLQVRGTTGASLATKYSLSLNAGSTGDAAHTASWEVQTTDAVPTVSQPSILAPVNGAIGLNPNSISPPGIILSASPYVTLNGAGAHQSTSWEVRKDATGGTTIVAVSNDTANLTQYRIPLESLMPNSVYYARVRYHSASAVDSPWSNWVKFETSTTFSLSWVKRFSSSSGSGGVPERLIWAGDRFLATGYLSNKSNRAYFLRSLDGKSWNLSYISVDLDGDDDDGDHRGSSMRGLCYCPDDGYTYAIGDSGKVLRTTNGGVSWSTVNTSGATIVNQKGLAYGAGVFVSVGNSGTIQTSSNSCVTWNLRSSGGVSDVLRDVIYANGKFWACGGNKILSSTNGVTWSTIDVGPSPDGKPLKQIAYREGYFVITRFESTYIETSPDGLSWTSLQVPHRFEFVASGGIWFVAGGSYSSDKFLVYSSVNNGANWNLDFSDTSQIHAHGFAYSPTLGRWAGVAHDFTAYSTI